MGNGCLAPGKPSVNVSDCYCFFFSVIVPPEAAGVSERTLDLNSGIFEGPNELAVLPGQATESVCASTSVCAKSDPRKPAAWGCRGDGRTGLVCLEFPRLAPRVPPLPVRAVFCNGELFQLGTAAVRSVLLPAPSPLPRRGETEHPHGNSSSWSLDKRSWAGQQPPLQPGASPAPGRKTPALRPAPRTAQPGTCADW